MKKTSMSICAGMIAAACALGCRMPEQAAAAAAIGSGSASVGQPASGYYIISPQGQPGSAVAVSGGVNAPSAPIVTESLSKSSGQEWLLKRQDDGSYKAYAFCAINSLQMLDASSGDPASGGATLVTGEDDAVDGKPDAAQRWTFTKIVGGYQIKTASGASALTATSDNLRLEPAAGDGSGQVFSLRPVTSPAVLVNPKKGLPTNNALLERAAHSLHCSWAYNWGIKRGADLAPDIQFVPMVWGLNGGEHDSTPSSGVSKAVADLLAQNSHTEIVLGYNEPDEPYSVGGSNIKVEDALPGFKPVSDLKSKGITVGGPACAIDVDDWMKTFMAQAAQPPYSYNIDFIGFHDYAGETNAAGAAYGLLGYCDAVHKLYDKPIWATEFAPTHLSQQDALTFIRIVCQGFQKRDYIQRYSMFTSEPASDSGMGASALVNPDGTLTEAGKLYARM